jgi:UrcA family protein
MMAFSRTIDLPSRLPMLLAVGAFAFGALALVNSRAQAAEVAEVIISAPSERQPDTFGDVNGPNGRDEATNASIPTVSRTVRLKVDPVMFTTNSGVALLDDKVREAAQKLCSSLDTPSFDENACVAAAIASARPQIAADVARAKANANG